MTPAKKATAKQAATKAPIKKAPAKKAAAKPAKEAAAAPAPARKAGAAKKGSAGLALLLTPGAGAARDHHTLLAVEEAARAAGRVTASARVDFPYRIAGRRAPDKAPVAVAHLVTEAEALVASGGIAPDGLVLGGRSYGGRMCSLAVAEGLPAAGLVLLSYPLHPPGKPENLRVEHFPALDLPVLFISGEKDPFGSPAELDHHVKAIPGPVTQVWLPGGHDPKNKDAEIAATVSDWIAALG
jgi:predicted alpha/beta-hydrolase family hydrolase